MRACKDRPSRTAAAPRPETAAARGPDLAKIAKEVPSFYQYVAGG